MVLFPFITLGIPFFDALYAIGRRLSRGVNPMKADRGHLHHRLLSLGRSHADASRFLVFRSGVLALAGIVATQGTILALASGACAAGGALWLVRRLSLLDPAVIEEGVFAGSDPKGGGVHGATG